MESWLSVTALPVLDPLSLEVVSVVTRFRDVTDERLAKARLVESGERLHAAQQLTGLAWWEYDVRDDRHDWSEQMFQLAGLDPAGDPPDGAGYLAMLHPEDRVTVDLGGRRTSGGRTPQVELFRIVQPDGYDTRPAGMVDDGSTTRTAPWCASTVRRST